MAERERLQGVQHAVGRNLKHRTGTFGAAPLRGAIEIAIAAQYQRGVGIAAIRISRERIKSGQNAAGGNLKYRAIAVVAAFLRSSIKIAIAALHQRGSG